MLGKLTREIFCIDFNAKKFTLEIDKTLVASLDHDGLVGGLVAFELVGRVLVADKSLLTLQHQDGSVN